MSKEHPHILITGGGTGGHVYPALAIGDEIRKLRPGAEFLYIGTNDKIEARVVPQRGYPFASIWISGFHRSLKPTNLLFPLKAVVSLLQSFFHIRRFRPDAVVGTGGYVCGPVLYVGSLLKVPAFIHESNSYPGITTRMLASRATKVFTGFDETARYLRKTDNVEHVGTPIRSSLGSASRESAVRFFGIEPGKKTVLVFGGSLGATSVNRALTTVAPRLVANGIQFIWQTGQKDIGEIKKQIGGVNVGWLGGYIDEMDYAYAAADLVICRSGASTIAELTKVGKPAILVPYPFAAANHQTMNARSMEELGAAVVVPDADVATKLEQAILDLLGNPQKQKTMAQAIQSLGRPDAGQVIAKEILAVIDKE